MNLTMHAVTRVVLVGQRVLVKDKLSTRHTSFRLPAPYTLLQGTSAVRLAIEFNVLDLSGLG